MKSSYHGMLLFLHGFRLAVPVAVLVIHAVGVSSVAVTFSSSASFSGFASSVAGCSTACSGVAVTVSTAGSTIGISSVAVGCGAVTVSFF